MEHMQPVKQMDQREHGRGQSTARLATVAALGPGVTDRTGAFRTARVGGPRPPAGTAGLRSYAIRFDSSARLDSVLRRVPDAAPLAGGYSVTDPAGNMILLTA